MENLRGIIRTWRVMEGENADRAKEVHRRGRRRNKFSGHGIDESREFQGEASLGKGKGSSQR